MKRTICIPNVNEGKSFEVPERKTKHRLSMYKKMIQLKEDEPKLLQDKEYEDTIRGAWLALYMIQDIYPKASIDDILDMPDDGKHNSLLHLSSIAYNQDFDELLKKMDEISDFRQTKNDKKK